MWYLSETVELVADAVDYTLHLKKIKLYSRLNYCNNGIKIMGHLIETSVLWLYWFASFKSENGILHTIFVMQKFFEQIFSKTRSLSCEGKSNCTSFQLICIKMWFTATWCFLDLFFYGNNSYTVLVLPQTLYFLVTERINMKATILLRNLKPFEI